MPTRPCRFCFSLLVALLCGTLALLGYRAFIAGPAGDPLALIALASIAVALILSRAIRDDARRELETARAETGRLAEELARANDAIPAQEPPPATEAPRDGEELYRLIAENSSDLISMLDLDGNYVYASPSHRIVLGYEPDQLQASPVFALIHPLDQAAVAEQWSQLVTGDLAQTTFRMRHTDGSWCWFEVASAAIARQGSSYLVWMARDVTARKQTEQALVRLRRRSELILASAGEGIYGLDLQGRATFVNPAAARMLGCAIGELIGQPIHELTHHTRADGEPYPEAACPVTITLREGERQHVTDELFWRQDGSSFPVEYISTPIREGGALLGAVVTFQDITERKQLEAQLLQAQKMESVGRLASGVAHDFNNLLTGIIGYADLALMTLPPDSEARCDIDEVQKAAQRAANLTRQLLAFARKQVMAPRILNLNDLILDMDKLLRRLIGEDIELLTLPAPGLGLVRADPGQIEQVLVNLAVNARDAMPHGGRLMIETANVELDHASARQHSGLSPGSYALLAISDTGVGMPPEVRAHLFEPFFTTKEPGRGTGLGLATCYGIITQHGGAIEATSAPGQGTTFSIYLPLVQEGEEAYVPFWRDVEDALPRGTETVLLVEDDSSVRALAGRLLREQGYRVIEAGNGEEALYVARQHPAIDLLFTDVVMPQMGGKALAEQLVAQRPEIKVLFTSGYAENAILDGRPITPETPFLQKPFSPADLAAKVRAVLDS